MLFIGEELGSLVEHLEILREEVYIVQGTPALGYSGREIGTGGRG